MIGVHGMAVTALFTHFKIKPCLLGSTADASYATHKQISLSEYHQNASEVEEVEEVETSYRSAIFLLLTEPSAPIPKPKNQGSSLRFTRMLQFQ